MEALRVDIRYGKQKADMTAEGTIGTRVFQLKSDGSWLGSHVRVEGILGTDEFMLEGQTKNLINRNFKVAGHWAGTPLALQFRVDGSQYSLDGTADEERIEMAMRRGLRGEVRTIAPPGSMNDLRFSVAFDSVLEGTVGTYLFGGVFAAFLPCLLRNQHGSISPFAGGS